MIARHGLSVGSLCSKRVVLRGLPISVRRYDLFVRTLRFCPGVCSGKKGRQTRWPLSYVAQRSAYDAVSQCRPVSGVVPQMFKEILRHLVKVIDAAMTEVSGADIRELPIHLMACKPRRLVAVAVAAYEQGALAYIAAAAPRTLIVFAAVAAAGALIALTTGAAAGYVITLVIAVWIWI